MLRFDSKQYVVFYLNRRGNGTVNQKKVLNHALDVDNVSVQCELEYCMCYFSYKYGCFNLLLRNIQRA